MACHRRLLIGFAWDGYPMYAARLIRALVEAGMHDVVVAATPSPFPAEAITETSLCQVKWIDRGRRPSWQSICGRIPDVVFSTGWAFPFCSALAAEAKRAARPVICMADNRLRGDFRQLLGAVRFRAGLRQRYDGFLVPGRAATDLMHYFGVPDNRLWRGLYGADPAIFGGGPPVGVRPREILYVGQMVPRKGVDVLLEAFRRSGLADRGWLMRTVGDGPLDGAARATPGCIHHPFLSMPRIANLLRAAAICVLPSRDDNWGVALHEGALAGAVIVASDAVGAAQDLIAEGSERVVKAGDPIALSRVFQRLAAAEAAELEQHAHDGLARANAFGPARFVTTVNDIIAGFGRAPVAV